jgi:hypothetical protein
MAARCKCQLRMLNAATTLDDLHVVPGSRLETSVGCRHTGEVGGVAMDPVENQLAVEASICRPPLPRHRKPNAPTDPSPLATNTNVSGSGVAVTGGAANVA